MRLSAIIVAAGSSTRVGFDKLFAQLAGRSVIQHTLEAFEQAPEVDEIILVCREITTISALAAQMKKVHAVIPGGERRQDSVAAGLRAVSTAANYIAVHDAARPLITPAEINRVFFEAQQHGAAVLASPLIDTLKLADSEQFVTGSVDRANVFAMQTPQIFARDLLLAAFHRVTKESLTITDEVSAVQNTGIRVKIVPARCENMKITFARDLAVADFILRQRQLQGG